MVDVVNMTTIKEFHPQKVVRISKHGRRKWFEDLKKISKIENNENVSILIFHLP